MKQRRVPPREANRFPDPAQGSIRIAIEQVRTFILVIGDQGAREIVNIRGGQVESFSTSRRNDMPRIAREKETTKSQGLRDKTMQGRNAHFEAWTGGDIPSCLGR